MDRNKSIESKDGLVRAIGRWSLTALVVNSVIGSGIFGLPDDVARYVREAGPWAYLIAAAGIGLIMGCFAEVASRFSEAGGPYLYAREAFGPFAGVQMGWFLWLVRLTSAAAIANLFVVYLGEFRPEATGPVPRAVILTVLLGLLAAVNIRGVKSGTSLSDFFTVAKLIPLAVFIFAGITMVGRQIQVGIGHAPAEDWLQALLVLIFAFGGFETAMMPMSEAKNPRKDAPFALFVGLAVITAVYILVHLVVMGAIPDAQAFYRVEIQQRPVAEAARVFLGSPGSIMVALGVMISTYGCLGAQFISVPRLTFAFAQQNDFPAFFAKVHPRFRTPYVSILIHTVLVWALAVYGSFIWNAILAAVARLFTYALVCGALPVLRRRQPDAGSFRLPGGILAAMAGIAFCLALVGQMGQQHLVIVLVVAAAATINWMIVKNKQRKRPLRDC